MGGVARTDPEAGTRRPTSHGLSGPAPAACKGGARVQAGCPVSSVASGQSGGEHSRKSPHEVGLRVGREDPGSALDHLGDQGRGCIVELGLQPTP